MDCGSKLSTILKQCWLKANHVALGPSIFTAGRFSTSVPRVTFLYLSGRKEPLSRMPMRRISVRPLFAKMTA
jgi:hypothetical protein